MINSVSPTSGLSYQPGPAQNISSKKQGKTPATEEAAFKLDLSVTSYKKDTRALTPDEIENLKDHAGTSASALKDVVEKLILRQRSSATAFSLSIEILGAPEDIEATVAGASPALSEDSDWGVEAVSDRIVSFARSLSGGDQSKISLLRDAIDKGFASAKKALGGKLPDISTDTYNAVMQKLDAWEIETE